MAILYYDEKKLFQLNTENTTYVIGLSPEGYVGHVYYGPLLHGEPDLYPLRMDEPPFTPSVNKREKSSSSVPKEAGRPVSGRFPLKISWESKKISHPIRPCAFLIFRQLSR